MMFPRGREMKGRGGDGVPGEALCEEGLNENVLIVEEEHSGGAGI